jgi:hypothetical protein
MRKASVVVFFTVLSFFAFWSSPAFAEYEFSLRDKLAGRDFVVLDAEGRKVGRFLETDADLYPLMTQARVAFSLDGRHVVVSLNPGGFKKGWISFESANCTGQAYGNLHDEFLFFGEGSYAVKLPGSTLYSSIPGAAFVPVVTRSRLIPSGECVSLDPGPAQSKLPIYPVVNLDDFFTPPFTIVGRAPELPMPSP